MNGQQSLPTIPPFASLPFNKKVALLVCGFSSGNKDGNIEVTYTGENTFGDINALMVWASDTLKIETGKVYAAIKGLHMSCRNLRDSGDPMMPLTIKREIDPLVRNFVESVPSQQEFERHIRSMYTNMCCFWKFFRPSEDFLRSRSSPAPVAPVASIAPIAPVAPVAPVSAPKPVQLLQVFRTADELRMSASRESYECRNLTPEDFKQSFGGAYVYFTPLVAHHDRLDGLENLIFALHKCGVITEVNGEPFDIRKLALNFKLRNPKTSEFGYGKNPCEIENLLNSLLDKIKKSGNMQAVHEIVSLFSKPMSLLNTILKLHQDWISVFPDTNKNIPLQLAPVSAPIAQPKPVYVPAPQAQPKNYDDIIFAFEEDFKKFVNDQLYLECLTQMLEECETKSEIYKKIKKFVRKEKKNILKKGSAYDKKFLKSIDSFRKEFKDNKKRLFEALDDILEPHRDSVFDAKSAPEPVYVPVAQPKPVPVPVAHVPVAQPKPVSVPQCLTDFDTWLLANSSKIKRNDDGDQQRFFEDVGVNASKIASDISNSPIPVHSHAGLVKQLVQKIQMHANYWKNAMECNKIMPPAQLRPLNYPLKSAVSSCFVDFHSDTPAFHDGLKQFLIILRANGVDPAMFFELKK